MASATAPFVADNRHCFIPETASECAMILLNTTTSWAFLRCVWQCASFRVAADGAATRLYRAVPEADRPAFLPDLICGDFDSVDSKAQEYYRSQGVKLLHDPDQDSTDLMKCLTQLEAEQARRATSTGTSASSPLLRVIVFGAFGGRLDQEMQNLNCLYRWSGVFRSLTLLSEDCVACLLPAGHSVVRITAPCEGATCGIIPLGKPVSALTTKGLHWDVTDWSSSFGTHISTSNRVEQYGEGRPSSCTCPESEGGSCHLHVTSSDPVIWTSCVDADATVEAFASMAAACAQTPAVAAAASPSPAQ